MRKLILFCLFISVSVFLQAQEFLEHRIIASNNKSATLLIDLIPGQTEITRPFIVAEGFDPGSILEPESEFGYTSIVGFIRSIDEISEAGDFTVLLDDAQEYDIIFVNWTNATDVLQDNAMVLREVIHWVNSQKEAAGSTEPNVLLGQSMGGVIGRYTLAKMEADNEIHDVRLFIAHDSPMQGANTPLSFQYFSRHAYHQYTAVPALYGAFEIVIPSIINLRELMGLENSDIAFPSIDDMLTIQDTPAAMQMNYHYVDILGNPTKAVHDSWQQEFESVGYPTQCRNIAISNGNECAADHGFNPRDKFISLHATEDPNFWGELIHLVLDPLTGIISHDLGLYILGQLPGSSEYLYDFDLHANPAVSESNREVYHGKLQYKKTFLWLIPITHTITERYSFAPDGYLPIDTYSGGFENFTRTVSENASFFPDDMIINPQYSFIPVVSALDIKRDGNEVEPNDYYKTYAGGETPEMALTTGFDNFIVDFTENTPINNEHISFQVRNGNWLARELNEDTNLIANCSDFCGFATINGSSLLCFSETYSVTNHATVVNWSISEGSNLVNFTENNNDITLSIANTNTNGFVVLNATFSNPSCGIATTSLHIQVGKPSYSIDIESGDSPKVRIKGEPISFSRQGITSIVWTQVGGDGYLSALDDSTFAQAYGTGDEWFVMVELEVTNSCGTSTSDFVLSPLFQTPGDDFLLRKVAPNRYQIEAINENQNTLILDSKIYNVYGMEEQGILHQNDEIELDNVQSGKIKIIKAEVDGKVVIKRIITD